MTETSAERLVSVVLRGGVLAAATIAAIGGGIYFAHHGAQPVDYRSFAGEPATLRSVGGIVRGALALQGESIIALGLLLLVATPIARVALLVFVFLRERDRLYVGVSLAVLAVLLVSVAGVRG